MFRTGDDIHFDEKYHVGEKHGDGNGGNSRYMMVIRSAQMAIFGKAATARHLRSILEFVRKNYPAPVAGISGEEALARIRWGLQLARKRGVTDSRAAALFASTLFAAGPTFYTHPACRGLLSDPRFHPNDRVFSLFLPAAEIPWETIQASRDDSAWQTVEADFQP